jgi:adenine C2-methylase RlmN of 23S rRNA A2503 and tRNA A37
MCWLTATGQTKYRDTTVEEYLQQAEEVFEYYRTQKPAELVHFNFMARGEPLDNPIFLKHADEVLRGLAAIAERHGLAFKFLISTIMPKSLTLPLEKIFIDPALYPEIYFSAYSAVPAIRKRWLPKAIELGPALYKLKQWQKRTGKIPKIHFAFIEGVNDTLGDMELLGRSVKIFDLKVNLNIVRYNPPTPEHSKEPSEERIDELVKELVFHMEPGRWRIVPRVGTDVMASCGTFLK